MQVLVVSTKQGRIVSMSRLGDIGEMVSGIGRAGVAVKRGQQMHEIDVPDEFRERSMLELHSTMHVKVSKGRATLLPVKRQSKKRATSTRRQSRKKS